MTGIRFNIRRRRVMNKKNKPVRAATDEKQDVSSAGSAGGISSPEAALVACIPCPALVIDSDRRIGALNDPFCEAFGVRGDFFDESKDFADFARRMSLSGAPGLLAVGDLLTSDKPLRDTEIVARNGTIYEARACRTADGKTLITLSEPAASGHGGSAERSHDVVKYMPGAALSVTRRDDGFIRCQYANALALELLGVGLREITGPDFDFRKAIAGPHRPDFEKSFERCAAGSSPLDMEFQVENAATGRRWVRCMAAAAPTADGPVIYYLRILDIENRRRIDKERRELQVLLDMVVDNIPSMVNVKDARDLSFVVVNRAFEELTGLSRDEILGQNDIHPSFGWDRKERKALYEQLLKTGQPVDCPDSTADTPDRGQRLLKSRKYPLTDQAGNINYILSITEDVTERRNAENALRKSEQRLRDAIESMTDGVALFDADNKMVMCNARYRTMWPGHEDIAVPGVSLETLVLNYLELAVAHGARLDIDTELNKALDQHRTARSIREVRVFDDRWIQVSHHPTADGGFSISCTDITALKEREESLRKASKQALHAKETAEGANRSKSDFLANMSHELRTPLNAVIGFSEIIRDALLGDHSIEPYRGYAQDIHDSGSHLLSLINDILDMSKIEAGKLELFEEEVDLAAAIDSSLRLVKERAHQNKVSLSTDIPDDLPRLTCDLRKFKQITINLLSNAVKFTPAGGTITTRLFIAETGDLHLQIADTGIGISRENLEKVLEPFGQAEGGLNRQFEGTGLGLTLTRSLAELHGGRVEIESVAEGPETGTTVTVIFPGSRLVS